MPSEYKINKQDFQAVGKKNSTLPKGVTWEINRDIYDREIMTSSTVNIYFLQMCKINTIPEIISYKLVCVLNNICVYNLWPIADKPLKKDSYKNNQT